MSNKNKVCKNVSQRSLPFGTTTIQMYPTFGAKYLKLRYTPNNVYKLMYLLSKYAKADDNINVESYVTTSGKTPSKGFYVILTFESILYSKWTDQEVNSKYSVSYSNLVETVQAVKAGKGLSMEVLDLFYKSISLSHLSQESQDEKMLNWLTSDNKTMDYYNWFNSLLSSDDYFNKYDLAAINIKKSIDNIKKSIISSTPSSSPSSSSIF
jgi:hypothetical protein